MAVIIDEDPNAEASTPLITDVRRVEVLAPMSLPEGYGLEVNTTSYNNNGEVVHSRVIVVSLVYLI